MAFPPITTLPPTVTPTIPTSTLELANDLRRMGFVTDTDVALLGYVKSDEVAYYVDSIAKPAKVPTPPVWDPIIIEKPSLIPSPYRKYSAPADTYKRPDFLSSAGLTLGAFGDHGGGGTMAVGGGLIADGPLRQIWRRWQAFTQRPEIAPPTPTPPDLTEIRTELDVLNVLLKNITAQMVTRPDLDPLKSGILTNYDRLELTNHDPAYGLVDVINRTDKNIETTYRYAGIIQVGLERTIARTDALRTGQSELGESIAGLRVLSGQFVTEETVTKIAQREANLVAVNVVNDSFKKFLTNQIFTVEADSWFDGQLAERNILTADALKGFDKMKIPFMKGGVVDDARVNNLTKLIDNTTPILDAVPKANTSWDELFTSTGIADLKTRLGVPAAFDISKITDSQITSLMTRAKDLPPLNALKDFFFKIVQARPQVKSGDVDKPGIYEYLDYIEKTQLGFFKGMQDLMFKTPFSYTGSVRIVDPTGILPEVTRTKTFTHSGLINAVTNLSKDISKWIDDIGGILILGETKAKLGEVENMARAVSDAWLAGITGLFTAFFPGQFPPALPFWAATPVPWPYARTPKDMATTVATLLPITVPAGW